MFVRLRQARRLSPEKFRLTLDVVDPQRRPWELGDCVVRVDLVNGPTRLLVCPRGILDPASDLYRLSPEEPPTSTESRLLWEMARSDRDLERDLAEEGLGHRDDALPPAASPGQAQQPVLLEHPDVLLHVLQIAVERPGELVDGLGPAGANRPKQRQAVPCEEGAGRLQAGEVHTRATAHPTAALEGLGRCDLACHSRARP